MVDGGKLPHRGVHALMGDGTVRFISQYISAGTQNALAKVSDNQNSGEF